MLIDIDFSYVPPYLDITQHSMQTSRLLPKAASSLLVLFVHSGISMLLSHAAA